MQDVHHKIADKAVFQLRSLKHTWGSRPLLMGIVNVTPDSFSNDGVIDKDEALHLSSQHLAQGADIIDIGAESTRPGHSPVEESEELRRILPVISNVRKTHPDAIISVDTSKASVLRQSLEHGADMLNSVVGLTDDLLSVVAEFQTPIVLMHNNERAVYDGSVIDEILLYFEKQCKRAVSIGLRPEKIILDPGIGFGKTADHNLEVLRNLDRLVAFGFPTLIGTSRKSFIGQITGKDVSDREFGTAATVALAVEHGIDIVRVHNVAHMKDVIAVSKAIASPGRIRAKDENEAPSGNGSETLSPPSKAANFDIIEIRGIRVSGKHGVSQDERQLALPLELDVTLSVDLTNAAFSDDINDTVCYSQLKQTIQQLVESRSFCLLEKLAVEILHEIFQNSKIRAAKISISKPERLGGATPTVTLQRNNPAMGNT